MSRLLDRLLKKTFRFVGLEVSRYSPSKSSEAQLRKVLDMLGVNMIFDVGANRGQFVKNLRQAGYRFECVSFEPLSTAWNDLYRFSSHDESWTVHERCAIGAERGQTKINIANNSVSSSILSMLPAHSQADSNSSFIAEEDTKLCRLDDLKDAYLNDSHKLFIKIDTQGYEWQVLEGAGQCLKRASGVLCELSLVPLYENQKLWRDVLERLESYGFSLWAIQPGFTSPVTGQSLQFDAIFIRNADLNCL